MEVIKEYEDSYEAYGKTFPILITIFKVVTEDLQLTDESYLVITEVREKPLASVLPDNIDKIILSAQKKNNLDLNKTKVVEKFVDSNSHVEYFLANFNLVDDKIVINEFKENYENSDDNFLYKWDNAKSYKHNQIFRENSEKSVRKKSDKELLEIVKDIHAGRIFTSLQVRSSDIGMVFMAWMLMNEKTRNDMLLDPPHMLYEFMDKAGPRAVNGYPNFLSFRWLNKPDTERLRELYIKYEETLKAADESILGDSLTKPDKV